MPAAQRSIRDLTQSATHPGMLTSQPKIRAEYCACLMHHSLPNRKIRAENDFNGMTDFTRTKNTTTNAGLTRRLAAMVYDGFLIAAIWLLSTLIIVAGFNAGEAIKGPAFQIFLYLEAAAFYIAFWRIRGQTLGMQVWKIRTVNENGELLGYSECLVRIFFATFSMLFLGLGFVWVLFDSRNLAWHDLASGTKVVFLGANAYQQDRAQPTPQEDS